MRNPNGYGTVAKLSGNRRRPYIVKKTTGWDEKGHPIYIIIGYASTREEGNILLADYNRDPWDVDKSKLTLEQLYKLWTEKKWIRLSAANKSSLSSAYRYCVKLRKYQYRQIKAYHMQETIDSCGKSYATQAAIKNLWKHLDRFALELDVISKCYSTLLTSDPIPPSNRIPFTEDEINTLWNHKDEPWVDTVLILLYSGWRISELLNLRPEDIDLNSGTMKGGMKTNAGKNRIVPIHSRILPFIELNLSQGGPRLISYHGNPMTQSQYRTRWCEMMKSLNMSHIPHECRHTFETRLDNAGANRKCIDLLMGHVSKDTGNRVYNHKNIDELKKTIELIT